MTISYSALMNEAQYDGEQLMLSISSDWMQGRTTYGGLASAICLEAVERSMPDLPPLRSAMISFIGPAGGEVTASNRLLRRGKSVAFVEAELHSEKGLATRCVFAFGEERQSAFNQSFTPMPDLPGPDECEVYIPDGFGPPFLTHFDRQLAKGARPMTSSEEYDHYIWTRHRDADAKGFSGLLALADMPPPAVLPMFKEPKPISSMTWQVNFLSSAAPKLTDWYLLQSRADYAIAGYSSQDMLIWGQDGQLVLVGRQNVAIFA